MNLEEHAAKSLVLTPAGIPTPSGILCASPQEAVEAFERLGPCAIKAQVPAGKRGKAGGIKLADDALQVRRIAGEIIGMRIGGCKVERLLVEQRVAIVREFYAAVLHDVPARKPAVIFSTEGGIDIEEVAAVRPAAIRRQSVDAGRTMTPADFTPMLDGLGLGTVQPKVADVLCRMHAAYQARDAELLEINPLAELRDGRIVALDCKFVLDDSAAYRQSVLAAAAAVEPQTELERRGREIGLKFIQLDGNVGVLANGAGLTMATMDAIQHFGGRPANFLEIGGEAYTKSAPALDLVLSNPGVRSLIVNFCGAYARTDVMAEGIVRAWQELKPRIPVFFSVHGTGQDEAIALIRDRLGIEPIPRMEDAVREAVRAAE